MLYFVEQEITINSRKFNGQLHRSWKCNLIRRKDSLLIFEGEFQNEIKHSKLGFIRRGTKSYEYYWLNRWFNVFRFHEPNGNLRNYYCNINMPPEFKNNILDYIDLEIDVVVWRNFEFEILDLDEFEQNSKKFQYSNKLKQRVLKTLDELKNLIKNREFPFDFIDSQITHPKTG